MLSWTKNGVALAVILAWLGSSISAAEPLSILREERHLRVAGISETWRLSWASLPRGRCQEELMVAITCPCSGIAYGEEGDLMLSRTRRGAALEVLRLTDLFHGDQAFLQRWPIRSGDLRDPSFYGDSMPAKVRRRRATRIMEIGDYNGDGEASEFLLLVLPLSSCGELWPIAVGLTKANPHLHAFGSRARSAPYRSAKRVKLWIIGRTPAEVPALSAGRQPAGGPEHRDGFAIGRPPAPQERETFGTTGLRCGELRRPEARPQQEL